jgi:hypothetical protein
MPKTTPDPTPKTMPDPPPNQAPASERVESQGAAHAQSGPRSSTLQSANDRPAVSAREDRPLEMSVNASLSASVGGAASAKARKETPWWAYLIVAAVVIGGIGFAGAQLASPDHSTTGPTGLTASAAPAAPPPAPLASSAPIPTPSATPINTPIETPPPLTASAAVDGGAKLPVAAKQGPRAGGRPAGPGTTTTGAPASPPAAAPPASAAPAQTGNVLREWH